MFSIISPQSAPYTNGLDTSPKKPILFLEQQSWMSGAQKVLEFVLDAVAPEFVPIVAFPHDGPYRQRLRDRSIKTVLYPLGTYQSGQKSRAEMVAFSVRSLACGLKLANLIRREKVALVYVNGPRCLPAGVVAARLTGRPLLFHLHLTLCRKREAMVVARLARYAGKIVSCSHAAAHPLLAENPALNKGLRVVYNPLTQSVGRADWNPDELAFRTSFMLGMVGRVTEPKGHLNLLKAVSALPLYLQKKIRLVMVGAPAPGNAADLGYANRVKHLAARLNLQNQIIWTGYQTDTTLFYAYMDVLVQPSSAHSGEGMPMVILEALREGIPVIASRTGGIPEVIRDGSNGLLVPPGDDGALARALRDFLEDPALRARLRAGARESLAEQFSLANFQSQTLACVRELIGLESPADAAIPLEEPAT
jgi:glycosyltransferase involved in cell wall biosynthesis